ncbi:MAG: XrtA/PEP-CTERM system-associated ATPase [Pseudomonadota bacterium]
MYESFYGLTDRPFRIVPDPDFLYLSEEHRLALVYLEYGLANQAGFIVITGEIGTGKTTLIRTLLRRLDQKTRVASIFNTTVLPDQLLQMVLREYEIPFSDRGKSEYLSGLYDFLIDQYRQGNRVVLIVDEAQNLSLEALEDIRLISNLQTEKEYLIQIILVGQPGLKSKLAHPQLAQFAQRISVQYHLVPLNRSEVEAYISHRLRVAGYTGSGLFSTEALDLIYESSKGTPRVINLICDAALVYGFADELKTLDRGVIEQVLADKKEDALLFPGTEENGLPYMVESAASEIEKRLCRLETEMEGLKEQCSRIGYQAGQDRSSVLEFEALLREERRKNQELAKLQQGYLQAMRRFKEENEALKNRLAELEPKPKVNSPPEIPTKAAKARKKGFWSILSK